MSRTINVAALSLGRAAGSIINIGTTVVMTRVLSVDDLAAYRQTFLAYAALAPLLSLGINQGMYYLLPSEKSRVRGRILDGMLVLGIAGIVFGLFLGFGGNEFLARQFSNPALGRTLLWMIPFVVLTTPSGLIESVFITQQRAILVSAFSTLKQLLVGIATLLPLLFWKNLEAPLIGNVIASSLTSLASIHIVISSVDDKSMPSVRGVFELLCFSFPVGLAAMSDSLSRQLDKVLVAYLCTPSEFAVYSLGAIELPIIGIVTGSVSAIVLADLRSAVTLGDHDEAIRLFRRTAEKTSLILLPAFFYFLLVADGFVTLLYTDDYKASAIPLRWYLFILPIRTAYFSSLLLALGKSRFILFRSIMSLIFNAIATYLFIEALGSNGAVIATILVKYLWAVPVSLLMLSGLLQRNWSELLPFAYFGRICLELCPLLAGCLLLIHVLPDPRSQFVAITCCFTVFLVFWWRGRLYSTKSIRRLLEGASLRFWQGK